MPISDDAAHGIFILTAMMSVGITLIVGTKFKDMWYGIGAGLISFPILLICILKITP